MNLIAPLRAALVAIVLSASSAAAEPSAKDLAHWCSVSDPVLNQNCRMYIEGFVAGVAVRTYNDRAHYCLGRPLDEYIMAFLAMVGGNDSLREQPRASSALYSAMTGYLHFKGACRRQ